MNTVAEITTCNVMRYDTVKNNFNADKKSVAVEIVFNLLLNGKAFRKIFCSPSNLEDLVTGILAQAGKIHSAADITRLEIGDTLIEVETKNTSPTAQFNSLSAVRFVAKDIFACADKFLSELSITHNETRGVHSGILFDGKKILLFREDIGRHNVFDKIYGAALREKIFLGDKALIFSGRCSGEMIIKVMNMKIPIVVAKSVPTTYSISLAKKFGITLVGRLTADSFCIYTNSERIVLSEEG